MVLDQGVPYLVLVFQLLAAVTLIHSGGMKLAEPSAIRHAVEALDIPHAPTMAALLALLELGTAVTLILLPGNLFTVALIVTLASIFTTTAALALHRHVQVECACFSSSGSSTLGWRQVVLAPVWLAVAVSVIAAPVVLADQRPTLTLVMVGVVTIGAVTRLLPLLIEHRVQRRIIEGTA